MTIDTIVQKWGDSLAIRIPKDIAERAKIRQGSEIEMLVVENEEIIILIPKKQCKRYSLVELLTQCKLENCHRHIDLGIEGNELI